MTITFRSAPEFASIDTFALYLLDDERMEFTHEDLAALNYRLRRPVAWIRSELEAIGFTLQFREPGRRIRGFQTSSNDRYYGPGSDKTHGGSGFTNDPPWES